MRIGLLGPSYPFRGGIAHYTTLLCQALQPRHEVRFLTFRRQYPAWLYPGRSDRDVSATPLRVAEAEPVLDSLDPRTWLATGDRLADWVPDLTIVPWWTAYWALPDSVVLARLRRRGYRRTLFLCHNVMGHERGILHRLAGRLVLRQGQAFIAHSESEAAALRALVPGTAVRCTPHPTYGALSRGTISRHDACYYLGLNGPVLLFFGFVRPYKGLSDLLAALPRVLARHPVTLLVVGEFWQPLAEYERQARALGVEGAVRFVDRYISNEEVPLYFAAANLVVLPYRSVTGSGVAQLALGCMRPVVATRTGSLADTIDEGRTGFLTPPGDPPALAEAILHFLDLPAAEQAAFEERILASQERFSWDELVACIESAAAEIGIS